MATANESAPPSGRGCPSRRHSVSPVTNARTQLSSVRRPIAVWTSLPLCPADLFPILTTSLYLTVSISINPDHCTTCTMYICNVGKRTVIAHQAPSAFYLLPTISNEWPQMKGHNSQDHRRSGLRPFCSVRGIRTVTVRTRMYITCLPSNNIASYSSHQFRPSSVEPRSRSVDRLIFIKV